MAVWDLAAAYETFIWIKAMAVTFAIFPVIGIISVLWCAICRSTASFINLILTIAYSAAIVFAGFHGYHAQPTFIGVMFVLSAGISLRYFKCTTRGSSDTVAVKFITMLENKDKQLQELKKELKGELEDLKEELKEELNALGEKIDKLIKLNKTWKKIA
jgi:hypothetical protein